MTAAFLDIRDLETRIFSARGAMRAVDGLSLQAGAGEAVGLIGESGSGKSLTALSVARLLPKQARIMAGSILFDGEDLVGASEARLRQLRRSDIAMIFQDAGSYLNPIMTIGEQIAEATGRRSMRRPAERERVIAALAAVQIADPARVAASYPHELSGGMQQRAIIASVLIREPRLIIADEPTTALDATVQREILKLLADARQRTRAALLFISHDLAVVANLCQRVYIMYAGQIVEEGPTQAIFQNPRHPYTQALLASILDPWEQTMELHQLAGDPPDMSNPPAGCRFHPRCKHAIEPCSHLAPPRDASGSEQSARCWLIHPQGVHSHADRPSTCKPS